MTSHSTALPLNALSDQAVRMLLCAANPPLNHLGRMAVNRIGFERGITVHIMSVNIMSMLVRLQNALGASDLIDQIVLSSKHRLTKNVSTTGSIAQDINLVVGYNSSPKSQTALDLTLWLAYQTRLVTRRPVVVQVVYVIDTTEHSTVAAPIPAAAARSDFAEVGTAALFDRRIPNSSYLQAESVGMNQSKAYASHPYWADSDLEELSFQPRESQNSPGFVADQFEQADRILWQARCLANEWRGSLKTHLRFGRVAHELRQVVEAESATLLWLGCGSADNRIVQELGPDVPCPVLGTPPNLYPERYFE